MRDFLESMATILLMGVAVTMLGMYLHDRARSHPISSVAEKVDDWEQHNQRGVWLGRQNAQIVITEFMEFTCPHCRDLVVVTDSLYHSFPEDVAIVFHHFPLRGRPFSMDLAIAAECALEQERFWPMYRVIFSHPGIQSRRELSELASSAGVVDLGAFSECMERPEESFERIREGREIGRMAGVAGTPTVWVNGTVVNARSFDTFVAVAEREGFQLR